MIQLEEAQARLLALATPLPAEHASLEDATGLYLAQDLFAGRTQPAADLSAMDGYAVAAGDMAGPWQVVGESAAGHPFAGTITAGRATRISTGALVPQGAGAVICQEDISRNGDTISLSGTAPHPAGRHIRRAGFDFAQGAPLLAAGSRIGPAQLALAIAGGHSHLPVRRAARIAIIDSGDELAMPGAHCAHHQIPASNGAMLAAMLAPMPCRITRHGPVPDLLDALAGALQACEQADIIVTSGGASVGDHDLLQPALESWGAQIDFWKVAIRPGKPLLIARRGAQIIVGLPGNPVSSMVTAHLFLLPLIRAMLGAARPLPMRVRAPLADATAGAGTRREFQRGYWDGARVFPNPMRDSSALAAMAASNCLIDRPIGSDIAAAGDLVDILLTDPSGLG